MIKPNQPPLMRPAQRERRRLLRAGAVGAGAALLAVAVMTDALTGGLTAAEETSPR